MPWAIITGGAFEFVGGVILVWQLGLVSAVETDSPPWLQRLVTHARSRRDARRKNITLQASGSAAFEFTATATGTVTPPPPPHSGTVVPQVVTWIQERLASTNELIEQGQRMTKADVDSAMTELETRVHALVAEVEEADLRRRTMRGRSGNWQAFGTLLILRASS